MTMIPMPERSEDDDHAIGRRVAPGGFGQDPRARPVDTIGPKGSGPAGARWASGPSSCPGTSRSSWMATADGRRIARPAPDLRPPQGIRSVRVGRRGRVSARPRPDDALLPLGRELEAAPSRAEVPPPAPPPLPRRRARGTDGAEGPPDHDRPPRRAARPRCSTSLTARSPRRPRTRRDDASAWRSTTAAGPRSPTPPAGSRSGRPRSGRLDPESVDESDLRRRYLSTAGMPDPDLLIRTAGEMRVSNYLLWQISYAELWVTADPLARLPGRPPARSLRGLLGPQAEVRRAAEPGRRLKRFRAGCDTGQGRVILGSPHSRPQAPLANHARHPMLATGPG